MITIFNQDGMGLTIREEVAELHNLKHGQGVWG